MKYKNMILIGTSHIAKESLDTVKSTINRENPDIIALELDKSRFYSLMEEEERHVRIRDIFKIGLKGWVFALIGAWAEKKLGNMVGVSPGSEMILAAKLAKKKRKKIALIDQNIKITLKRLSKKITWKEKWRFLIDIVKAIVFRKKEIDFDLTKVPSKKVIDKLIGKVKKRYPNIYLVLIKERNHYMARKLKELMDKNEEKKIVALVGAGHEEEIIDIIKKIEKGWVTYTD
ncbi:MAG: TraB/GumN family protein [Candidatus Woesearchaeota archaeon]